MSPDSNLNSQTRIALLFFAREKEAGKPLLAWPHYDFDPQKKIYELIEKSNKWSKEFNNKIIFTLKKWIKNVKDLEEVRSNLDKFDGMLIYILTTSLNYKLFLDTIREINKPTIIFTEPYHSLAWPEISALMREGKSILTVTSSSEDDLLRALNVLHSYIQLRRTKVLVISTPKEMSLENLHTSDIYVGDRIYNEYYFKRIRELLRLEFVDYKELIKKYNEVKDEEARLIAETLKKNAYWINDNIRSDDLVKAAKLYLASKKLIEERNANALAINDFTIMMEDLNALPVTPCVAITLLNDEGIPTACEADLNSLILQIIFKHLANRPAWITDPVFDFKDKSVIYVHCTAPTRMAGFRVKGEPYALDTHDETGKPVTVRTKFKVGQEVTIAQISWDFKKLIMRKTRIIDTPIIRIGCRTKAKTYADNIESMLWRYEAPLHRVLVYGDWTKELIYLAKLMNLEVFFEEKA